MHAAIGHAREALVVSPCHPRWCVQSFTGPSLHYLYGKNDRVGFDDRANKTDSRLH